MEYVYYVVFEHEGYCRSILLKDVDTYDVLSVAVTDIVRADVTDLYSVDDTIMDLKDLYDFIEDSDTLSNEDVLDRLYYKNHDLCEKWRVLHEF